jgi:hypothetical protein
MSTITWLPTAISPTSKGIIDTNFSNLNTDKAETSGKLSQFAATTSLELKGVISDETGSGSLVFATSPTLVTPVLWAATATTINGATITSGTLNWSVTGTNTGNQTIANTSAATTHTVTLSATGGSVQLVEGANITLTTTWTSADGIITIASTGGGGTGDVVWPASATDNAIARFDATTGKLIQNSILTLGDLWQIGWNASFSWQIDFTNNILDSINLTGWLSMIGWTYRSINDWGSNELIKFPTTSVPGAVNEFTISNAATGTWPILSATGWDPNIEMNFQSKWTWPYNFKGTASWPADIRLFEDTDNGTNYISVIAPATIASNAVQTLPATTGTLVNRVTTANGVSASNTDGALSVTLGAITPTTVNGNTISTWTGTLTLGAGKTLTVNNSIALTGTDATTMTFPTTSKTLAANDGSNMTLASQAIGDIITASSTTAINRLADVAVWSVLVSGGVWVAPAYSANPQVTTIELGNASDTTLSRVSAGVIAVEGTTINGYATTATAAGTTTLTIASPTTQFFTGSTTQTVTLSTTSILAGQTYRIKNNSTGNVTVQSSGANTIQIIGAGMECRFTAIVATPTTAANWSSDLEDFTGVNLATTATANAATINLAYKTNTITNNSAATLTITLPTAGAIDWEIRIVRVLDFSAVAQTVAWVNTENSDVSAPVTSNWSTTLPRTTWFQYNLGTTKWRTIATA